MKTICLAIATALFLLPIATINAASPTANCGCTSTSSCGTKACCKVQCSACGKTCVPELVKTEKTNSCYNVACKDICIPKITFPWQKCCTPQCGKVISVRVLKKVEYKCPSCKYQWSVVSSGCGECGTAACGCDSDTTPVAPTPKVTTHRVLKVKSVLNRPPVPPPVVIQQTKYFRSIYGVR